MTDDSGPTSMSALARALRPALEQLADPQYAPGKVAARSPGKPVLGIRIPLLRDAVRRAAREVGTSETADVLEAADVLWHGATHEEELAACMLMRICGVRPSVRELRGWAPLLDNWLSVDELSGCTGRLLGDDPAALYDLEFLALSHDQWQRRLYLASLLIPLRQGMDAGSVPHLAELFTDSRKPVRAASAWLLRNTMKYRPEAGATFMSLFSPAVPSSLTRLVTAAESVQPLRR